MSTLLVAATLALEALFTAMFARSVPAGLAVALTFGALLALRRPMVVARYVLVPYVFCLAYCLWLCRSLAPVPFMLMLAAQQVQVFAWWLGPQPGCTASAEDGRTAGAVFIGCGLVTAYFALAGTAIPPPPVSRAMGTIILVLSVMAIDIRRVSLPKGGPAGMAGPWIRAGVIATMAYLALQLANPLAGPCVNTTSSLIVTLEDWLERDTDSGQRKVVRVRRSTRPEQVRGSGRWPKELLADTDTPHVHLKVPDPQEARRLARRPIYLRVATHDTFGDAGWTNAAARSEQILDRDDGVADNVISLRRTTSATVTYNVYTRFHAAGLMPLMPGTTAVHLPAVLRKSGDTYSSPLTENLFRFSYTAVSAPKSWPDMEGKPVAAARTGDEYLRLPDTELGSNITELAETVRGSSSDPRTAIGRLVRHLRGNHSYTRWWPGTVDPQSLDSFLFEGKPGNCQAFATSLALTLRSLNVPARVGLGYCAGELNPDTGVYSFYADHAHAWTEVHLKDQGWVVVDATPPSFATVARRDEASIDLSAFPGLADLLDKGILARGSILSTVMSAAILIFNIALVLGAVAMLVLARGGNTDAGRTGPMPAVTSGTPDFYRFFCRSFGKAGCPIRTGQTAREYLATLKERELLHDECDDIIEYLYRVCYENATRNPGEERLMKTRIRRLRESV